MLGGGETGEPESGGRPGLLASALSTYATNILVAILSLGNVLVVARALGPSGRGNVALLTAIAYLTANIAMLGVQEANANLGAGRPEARRVLAGNSLVLALLIGSAAALVLHFVIRLVPAAGGDDELPLRLAFAALPVLVLHDYLEYLVRAGYGYRIANLQWICAPVTNIVVNSLLAATGRLTVGRAFATWVGGWTIATLLLALHVAFRGGGFGRPSPRLAREQLGFGVKTHAGRIFTLGNYRLDQWLLGAMSGARQLGLYSVAVAWAEILFFLPTALTLAQRPHLVQSDEEGAGRDAARIFRFSLAVSALFTAVLVAAAPILCVTVFGESFRGSVEQLRLLAPGALGIVALKQLGNALTARGRPLRAAAATAVAFGGGLVLDLVLIPRLGGVGAAAAATLAYTGGGVVVGVVFARALHLRLRELLPHAGDVQTLTRLGTALR
jgi:O-antigen/teichoic acid export membrane protein